MRTDIRLAGAKGMGRVMASLALLLAVMLALSACSSPGRGGDGDNGTTEIGTTDLAENPRPDSETASVTEPDPAATPEAEASPSDSYLDRAKAVVSRLTVRQMAEATMMPSAEGGAFFAGITTMTDAEAQSLSGQGWFGLLLSTPNIESPGQLRELTDRLHAAGASSAIGVPMLLAVDEEGGLVRRIGGRDGMGIDAEPSAATVGADGNADAALEAGRRMGGYLADLGFDIDFAPVADVRTPSCDEVMSSRCFSDDARIVADMAIAQTRGLAENGVSGCLKHYPGLGPTYGDSHEESVTSGKTLDELMASDLVPYAMAQEARCAPMVMVGHILVPNLTDDGFPASLSPQAIATLRDAIGYDGLIITDALNMQAALDAYPQDDLAWHAIAAGADVALMPIDPIASRDAMVAATERGDLDKARLEDAATKAVAMRIAASEGDANPWD